VDLVERVEALHLDAGDVIVMTIDDPDMNQNRLDEMRLLLEARFPGHKALIINGDFIRVGALGRDEVRALLTAALERLTAD
jgi:hypothetical protein